MRRLAWNLSGSFLVFSFRKTETKFSPFWVSPPTISLYIMRFEVEQIKDYSISNLNGIGERHKRLGFIPFYSFWNKECVLALFSIFTATS